MLNQTGTPRNDRSIICKRPSQLYQNQTQLITPKVNLRCIKSTEKPLYSSLSIHNHNSNNINHNHSNKEIFCFEDDVQQLNIASEENELFCLIEHATLDSNKGIEKSSIVSDSTVISPVQIKKIFIENYRNEKIKESIPMNADDNNINTRALSNQGMQHSFSAVSQSPNDQLINTNIANDNINNDNLINDDHHCNDNGNNTNTINANSNFRIFSEKKEQQDYQINHSNFFFNIPSINIIYKSQDNKERAKSFAPNQRNYSNFEKIKKPNCNSKSNSNNINQIKNNNQHNKGQSSKQVNHQKRIKSFIERKGTNDIQNQWETLSSRIKCHNSSKPKDSTGYSTNVKQSIKSNYPIVSEIHKKLFNDINTTCNKKYLSKQSYSNNTQSHQSHNYNNNNTHHQKQWKSINPFRRKEYLNIVENLDDKNFDKIIQIIEKISVDPLANTMKEKKTFANKEMDNINNNINSNGNSNNNTIKKLSLTTIAKSSGSSTIKKQYPNAKEIKVNYIKTDLFNLNQYGNSSKSSFVNQTKQPNYSVLSLHILSNWGSKTKVGVTEIQLFDSKGKKIPVCECHVFNGSEDNINRIINKKTRTINDNDMWSTTFASNIKIEVYFDSETYDVASVTIWNYNGKDLQRGIKEIELSRKNVICWKGIVQRGCFNIKTDYSLKIKLASINSCNPSTNANQSDNRCLYEIIPKAAYDSFNIAYSNCDLDCDTQTPSKTITHQIKLNNIDKVSNGSSSSARNNTSKNHIFRSNKTEDESKLLRPSIKLSFKDYNAQQFITFSKIRIEFKESYGNKNYIGLTGMKFVNKDGISYSVDTAISVGALPKDLSSEYNIDDPQIFENVFNNINETNDISNMWLTVFNNPYIEICYETQQTLSQLLIWNYNNPESLDKCSKVIEIAFDDNGLTSSEVLLMKGTGMSMGDYSQTITFPFTSPSYENMINPLNYKLSSLFYENNYVSPLLPSGFWFKFILLSNYGDHNYIGLNAIEFFDLEGRLIIPLKIISDPEMKLIKDSSAKVIDNANVNENVNDYWVTPFYNMNKTDNMSNESVFTVVFAKIVSVSYIKIYNLIKEPKQGVRQLQIICDDSIIFEGELNKTKERYKNENYIFFVHNDRFHRNINEENIIGTQLNKEQSLNNNTYQTRKTRNGFAMTLKGYN